MLHAKRIHLPSQTYELTEDGRKLTTFSLHGGHIGARFTLNGADYSIRSHRFSGAYELLDGDGKSVAATDRMGRSWNLTCGERVIRFRRSVVAGREHTMLRANGEPAGTIRRTGHSGATADLPDLETVLQVFALVAVVLRRRRKQAAAVARSAALG